MGTFARLLKKDGAKIPQDKYWKFRDCVERLFQAGGMMEIRTVQLCEKQVYTVRPAVMYGDGIHIRYNYYEDNCWEDAGFDQGSCSIYSGEMSHNQFYSVMMAAYILEELFLESPAIPMVNGKLLDSGFVDSSVYMGWIHYLFPELDLPKNRDLWGIFEMMHEQEHQEWNYVNLTSYDWEKLANDRNGVLGAIEIEAVMHGAEKLLALFIEEESEKIENNNFGNPLVCLVKFKEEVDKYKKESSLNEKEQLSLILDIFHAYYDHGEERLEIYERYRAVVPIDMLLFAVLSDAPAFVVKILAEIYDKEFWELWDSFKDTAGRKYHRRTTAKIEPVTTSDFLKISPDDMILFWEGGGDIIFSDDLQEWFKYLKGEYDKYKENEFRVNEPVSWIVELMEYAYENYYCIAAIESFLHESIEHRHDDRYHILWKLYDDMLHDPKMEEEGSVIFVSDIPKYKPIGMYYLDGKVHRYLRKSWDFMCKDEKFNKARTTFRRYMALVANQELRKQVFGF